MLHRNSTIITLCLCTSALLMGAGPRGCGPLTETRPLEDPLHPIPDSDDDTDECGPVCELYCEFGNVLDENGCPTCTCNPPPLCLSDSDCVQGQICDLSVCLSPCTGGPDEVCPAVCYGQCTPDHDPACDPSILGACGDGYACVCEAGTRGDGANGGSARPGLVAPPIGGECTCQPIEPPPPPPPACDPGQPDSCGEGSSCICAAADVACRKFEDGYACPYSEPQCWCQPNNPPTCDPANPFCENGAECVCYGAARGSTDGVACDPNTSNCQIPPPPEEICYCVEPPPPPPTCDPANPVCENGGECLCVQPAIACEDDTSCLLPDPICYCVDPFPPPPPSCDPTSPVCENGGECVCVWGCGICEPGETCVEHEEYCYCSEPPPPPPQTCDPENPVCDNGGECVCYATRSSGAAAPCLGDGCDVPPPPIEECYCENPGPEPLPPLGG